MDGRQFELDEAGEPAAVAFQHLLARHDPDLILSDWGDATILPRLREQAAKLRLPLTLNRDPSAEIHESRARSYMSYGRILFKNSATTLFGRLHVDTQNSFIADKCDLSGLWELARITKLPVQYCARTSTGTGISYMQMELAWRDGVLIPEQKAEPEDPKPPDELLIADRGGLVFTPKTGFHANVAELDFVSEYPSIMARFNISPETVNCPCCPDAPRVPELGYRVCQKRRGITSRVVERLIAKRGELKKCRARLQAGIVLAASARLKAGATRIGRQARIRKNSSATNSSATRSNGCWSAASATPATKTRASEKSRRTKRSTPSRAKRCWSPRKSPRTAATKSCTRSSIRCTCKKPARRAKTTKRSTRKSPRARELPLAIEAIYRYVVFLPSRQFADVPVPNRFFAVAEDGTLKVRGLELRRHDTPPLVARMQQEVLEILAEARDFPGYLAKLEEAREILRRCEESVADGSVAIEDLIISKRLTREPREYSKANQTAIVAQQLFGSGVRLRPGQTVEYIITDSDNRVPNDRVRAYALWDGWFGYDRRKYTELLHDAFDPLALVHCETISREQTENWQEGQVKHACPNSDPMDVILPTTMCPTMAFGSI